MIPSKGSNPPDSVFLPVIDWGRLLGEALIATSKMLVTLFVTILGPQRVAVCCKALILDRGWAEGRYCGPSMVSFAY
jgi:hypothetical protein